MIAPWAEDEIRKSVEKDMFYLSNECEEFTEERSWLCN